FTSSILSTVMENSASCSTGSVSPRNVFCSECEIHTDFEKKTVSGVGKEHVENVLEEHSQKGRDVQKRLNETTELREQQITSLRLIIADLQSKLMEVQLEGDALQDTREKGSQSQESVKIQLKNTIQELEAANRLQEEMLREADSQTEHLKKMVCSHEEVLLELRSILMDYEDCTGKKHYEHENITSLHIHSLSTAFADVLRDLGSEVSYLKERVLLVEEELESLKKDSRTQNQVLLQQHQNSGHTGCSKHNHKCFMLSWFSQLLTCPPKPFLSRKQTRNQISVRAHHISHLESTVSQLRSELREAKRTYEDKVEDLEKQLHVAHSEIAEAQTEQDQCSQESGNLNDRIHHLLMTELHKKEIQLSLEKEQNKRFWDQNADNSITVDHLRRELDNKNTQLQRMENTVKEMRTECHRQMARQMAAIKERNESFGKIFSLTVQLQSTKETLCKVKEDLTAKQTDLETAEKTVSDLTARLQEKERALEGTNKEIKKLHSQLGSRMQELQRVKNEEDCLHNVQLERETLKLLEKIKIIEIFQKQIDNMTQMVGQHSRTAEAMEVEKSQLVKEINDWKLKVEDLQIAKDEKEARIHEMAASLSELELEKVKLVETCSDRLHELNDMKLEKDQLMNELQACRSELASLAEGFEDVKRNYQGKMKETENTANRLKMQLKSAQAELEQTRSALKTMEGSDGHALKVAVGMQKQITAKRGQIDALQSKIKFLEEVVTNAAKEKHYLREENLKLSQELSCIAAENAKISGELEILRSRDKHLKEKIPKMETALDKASMQFAECQCIIQCQEQAAMRFRLQHTLDVK
ncbi:CD158 protein, partial [Steatornis caripensis]|nr:CD158 protein [Steatornis caripensis]